MHLTSVQLDEIYLENGEFIPLHSPLPTFYVGVNARSPD